MKSKKRCSSTADPSIAFINFLRRYGCLEAFMTNTLRSFSGTDSRKFLASLFSISPSDYLNSAFFWFCTPEGGFYWQRVDKAWAEYRSKYHIS